MSEKDEKLDKILKKIEELAKIQIEDITREAFEENMNWIEEVPKDSIQAFRITEKVYNEMEKELGEGWMNGIGIT